MGRNNRIRELRKESGLTAAGFAAIIGVHESTVSRWETGKSDIPDARKFEIADYFGVSVAYLMGWDDGAANGNGSKAAA